MTIEEIAALMVNLVRKARDHECFGVRLAERPDEELRHNFKTSYHDMIESQYDLLEAIKKYAKECFQAGFNRGLQEKNDN